MMISTLPDHFRAHPWRSAGLLLGVGASATILGALFFEHVIKLAPCPLCLEQRVPYYIAIPLGFTIALAAHFRAPVLLLRLGLVAAGAVMIWAAVLGIYHAGAEWAFWPGPTTCGVPAPITPRAGDLLRAIQTTRVADCTVVQWRFLGLSLAGWNAVIATSLAGIAFLGASRSPAQKA
jgi:disulfide bond formation protein DsbB